jgi:hypothetical protein
MKYAKLDSGVVKRKYSSSDSPFGMSVVLVAVEANSSVYSRPVSFDIDIYNYLLKYQQKYYIL